MTWDRGAGKIGEEVVARNAAKRGERSRHAEGGDDCGGDACGGKRSGE